jgi:hypothetical protein
MNSFSFSMRWGTESSIDSAEACDNALSFWGVGLFLGEGCNGNFRRIGEEKGKRRVEERRVEERGGSDKGLGR